MTKLSQEKWQEAREHWEKDSRPDYAWLVQELNLDVSRQAVVSHAAKHGWRKNAGVEVKPLKSKAGRKPGFKEPQTIRREAIELLKSTMRDENAPGLARVHAADVLVRELEGWR